ncbi:transcription regulator protein BACH1a [Brachyhypopomus gauderio]|uniref:transcription regulator protein BACH1a n=1 Tax=Brachyhypopomus gauderio TaxID=698409 RepID=UPI00404379F4
MSVDGVRTSVFIFQSAVHSVHVLRSLDQQRQEDVLCDVSVEVESRSFRAHSSVLACCSDYFYTRLLSHTGWNLVITLPDEVTVEGFVPLLQFAYTAKLHFTKENILEIHRCAELLGFHNLDKACFDFLIPKFSAGSGTAQEAKGRSQEIRSATPPERGPVAETGGGPQASAAPPTEQREPAMPGGLHPAQCSSAPACKDLRLDSSLVTFQGGRDEAQLCLQNCGPQLLASSSVASAEICPFLSIPCTSANEDLHPDAAGCDGDVLQMGEALEDGLVVDAGDGPPETSAGEDLNVAPITKEQFDQPLRSLETPLCPLSSTEASEVLDSIASASDLQSIGTEATEPFTSSEQIFPDAAHGDGCPERSTVEREVAEHLAKGFWPDLTSSLTETLESVDQTAVGNASDFHWLKHLNLGAAPDDCPFLRDLSSTEGRASQTDTESRRDSGEGSCASTINSGENSECDTEGDCVAGGVQGCEADLPVPVEQISTMSRRAFLRMLKEQRLSPEQLELVQDVRRRSKNRMAAQRCRKRKLDCIYRLEGDLKKLRTQKEKLLHEHHQLKRSMEDMRQSLSRLCQSVCTEASAQPEQLRLLSGYLPPEQLRLLSGYLPPDCPTSGLFTSAAPPIPAASRHDTLPHAPLEPRLPPPRVNGAGVTPTSASLPDGTQNDVTDSVT